MGSSEHTYSITTIPKKTILFSFPQKNVRTSPRDLSHNRTKLSLAQFIKQKINYQTWKNENVPIFEIEQ